MMSVPSRHASISAGGIRSVSRTSANAARTSPPAAATRVSRTRSAMCRSTLTRSTVPLSPDKHTYTSTYIPLTSPQDWVYAVDMPIENQRSARPLDPAPTPPKRLVKTWLPVDLVRQMDVAIVRSRGGYLDRAEFIAEAIRDRLAEEEAVEYQATQAPAVVPPSRPILEEEVEGSFADWLESALTLPAAEGPSENFGLHNRDLPTLWALDWPGRLAAPRNA